MNLTNLRNLLRPLLQPPQHDTASSLPPSDERGGVILPYEREEIEENIEEREWLEEQRYLARQGRSTDASY